MTTLQKTVGRKVRKSGSTKTPQYYNEQRKLLIAEMVSHEDETVRIAICSNSRCPQKMLKAQLEVEEELPVIKAILMNPSLPEKVRDEFIAHDPRGNDFDLEGDDSDLVEYLKNLDSGTETTIDEDE